MENRPLPTTPPEVTLAAQSPGAFLYGSPELLTAVSYYQLESISPGTKKVYERALADFNRWCSRSKIAATMVTTDIMMQYIASLGLRHLAPSTIRVRCAAIQFFAQVLGKPLDLKDIRFRQMMKGIARQSKGRKLRQAKPAEPNCLNEMLATLAFPRSRLSKRAAAMILVGYGAALRRSEIVALKLDDVTFDEKGLVICIRSSKSPNLNDSQATISGRYGG